MSEDKMPYIIYAVDFGEGEDHRYLWDTGKDWHDEYESKEKYYSESHVQHLIEQAFMAGQADCGIDPSYSSAQSYAILTATEDK